MWVSMFEFMSVIRVIRPYCFWETPNKEGVYTSVPFSPRKRKIYIVLLWLLLAGFIGCALTIPFVYESQSLWYKFGADKTMLRTGKMVGIVAAILLCCQVILAIRLRLLDRLLGLDTLLRLHRSNGLVLLFLVTIHASLIIIPEGWANLPIGWKYWPEMVGALMFVVLILLVCGALLRPVLRMKFSTWRTLHKPAGYILFGGVFIHVLYVSEAFTNVMLRMGSYVLFETVVITVCVKTAGDV